MVRRRSPVQARPTAFSFCLSQDNNVVKITVIFLVFFSFYAIDSHSQAILVDFNGEVKYRKNSLSEWEDVPSKNFVLNDGFAIKTKEGSKAKIGINKSFVWIKENSALEIESTSKYFTSFGLVYGKLKASVVGLLKKSKFQVRTITAVFGVRGTDIMVKSALDGSCSLDVLYGEVEFQYLIPPKKGERSFVISQGMSFSIDDVEKPYSLSMISKENEREILSNWDPSSTVEDSYSDIIKMEDRKERIRNFIAYSNSVKSEISQFVYKEKDSDFEAGRTLKDIHGNTVRIDQRLVRPDSKTLELFNIVKRKNYKNYDYSSPYSKNHTGFVYSKGDVPNRVDAFIITFSFNKDLPSSVNKWQSFFSDDSVNPAWATFVNANLTDSNVFFVAEAYKYIDSRDELINNTEVVGVPQNSNEGDRDVLITGVIDKSLVNDITMYNFREKTREAPTGELVKKNNNSDITGAIWGLKINDGSEINNNETLYQLKTNKYVKGAKIESTDNNDYFWLAQENYIISNSGLIKSRDDILSSNKSVSEIVKDSGLESISYVRKDSSGISDENYFSNSSNIDSILIGDVVFSMLEKVSGGVDKWKY